MTLERTRISGSSTGVGAYQYQLRNACQGWQNAVWNGSNTLFAGNQKRMTDVVTPGYYAISKAGGVVMSPMSISDITGDFLPEGYFHYKDGPVGCGSYTDYAEGKNLSSAAVYHYAQAGYGGMTPSALVTDAEINDAVIEAATSVQGNRGRIVQANLTESIAQTHLALRILPNVLQSLQHILTKDGLFLRTNSPGGRAARYKARTVHGKVADLAGLYLIWRYGVSPLVSDVDTIIKGASKAAGKVRISTRENVAFSRSDNRQWSSVYGPNRFDMSLVRNDQVTVRALSVDEVMATRATYYGFDIKSFVTTPWELVPASFVIDWFYTVDTYLRALVPAVGVKTLGSCYTVDRVRTANFAMGGQYSLTPSTHQIVNQDRGQFLVHNRQKQRAVGLPAAGIVTKADFRFSSMTRLLDASALTYLLLRRSVDKALRGKPLSRQRNRKLDAGPQTSIME